MHKNILYLVMASQLIGSDVITVDSLFKESKGLRSITTFNYVTSGNARKYTTYPDLIGYDDGQLLVDSKRLVLGETLLYELTDNCDLIFNVNASHQILQYNTLEGFQNETTTDLDSIWIGFDYKFESINQKYKPSIVIEVPLYEHPYYNSESGDNYLRALYVKAQISTFSDPLISSVYISTLQNFEKDVGPYKVKYPSSYAIGYDLSFIVNPDVVLTFSFAQRFQTSVYENGTKINPSTNLPTMGIGATYSIDEENSFSILGTTGNSASAPDSTFSMALWHKF